jgi:hypothetical protein
MSVLKLTYCQLIKIVLSQIGGNPLQQVYSQLSQGMPMISARSGLLPTGLSEVRGLIERVTNTINDAQRAVNDYSDVLERLGTQLYINPLGLPLTGTIAVMQSRLDTIDTRLVFIGLPYDERIALLEERQVLTESIRSFGQYKDYTDRLSGIGPQSGASSAGGCSLQDLLGSGCAPNQDVPDIDLQNLIDSLKNGDLIAALKLQIENATGYTSYQTALASFQAEVTNFNFRFSNLINRAAIRNAVTSQITQIVFNLLSGCGNQVFNLTLNPDVRTALTTYVSDLDKQRSGEVYYDSFGNEIAVSDPTFTV